MRILVTGGGVFLGGEIHWDTSIPNGLRRRSLDASRATELLGFEARVPLDEGIRRTVSWYREHRQAVAHA